MIHDNVLYRARRDLPDVGLQEGDLLSIDPRSSPRAIMRMRDTPDAAAAALLSFVDALELIGWGEGPRPAVSDLRALLVDLTRNALDAASIEAPEERAPARRRTATGRGLRVVQGVG